MAACGKMHYPLPPTAFCGICERARTSRKSTPYLLIGRLCRRVPAFSRAHVPQLSVDSGETVREPLFEGLEGILSRLCFPWRSGNEAGGARVHGMLHGSVSGFPRRSTENLINGKRLAVAHKG